MPYVSPLPSATEAALEYRHGRQWLADLPGVISSVADELAVTPERFLPGGRSAAVLHAKTRSGKGVALKVCALQERSIAEAKALRLYHEVNVGPEVIAETTGETNGVAWHAYVLEFIPGPGDLRAPNAIAHVGRSLPREVERLLVGVQQAGLHPKADTVSAPNVTDRLERGLTSDSTRKLHGAVRPTEQQLRESKALLAELKQTSDAFLLHGALHPGNIAVTHSGSLLLLDPLPQTGDPMYDVAETALKLGSELQGLPHNVTSGMAFLAMLPSRLADRDRVEALMRVIADSGV